MQHPERLKKLSACTNVKGYRWRSSSAVLLPKSGCVPLTAKSKPDTDAAIAATHMLLEATDLGLSSCWLMHFDPAPIRGAIPHPPEGTEPEYILAIGYPAEDSHPPSGTPSASRWRILLLRIFLEKIGERPFLEKGPPPSKPPSPPKTLPGAMTKRKHIISFRRHPHPEFCTTKRQGNPRLFFSLQVNAIRRFQQDNQKDDSTQQPTQRLPFLTPQTTE